MDGTRNCALHGTHHSPHNLDSHTIAPHLLTRARSLPSPTLLRYSQLDKVRQGKFYILCPDNETRREVDQLRIMWGAGDVAEGRPALSRWHRDYKALFEEYVRDGLDRID